MFHLRSSIECLDRVMNNKKPIHLWIGKMFFNCLQPSKKHFEKCCFHNLKKC